jgi:CRISPR-associated endonuclease/helicase Cas3
MSWDEAEYRNFFTRVTGRPPYDYQVVVGQHIIGHQNVVLRAPTGAGKTWSVLVPFFSAFWRHRPSRLIYALPLRTLAQGVYREACTAAANLGRQVHGEIDIQGREVLSPYVTLQTGEQPDDPFFTRGRIIVTTYDQVLSGLLESPYGLSKGLHNINAAAVAGALVVFDEFHLMPPDKVFLTAVAGMRLFKELCQSVWMTATATAALQTALREALTAEPVPGNAPEWEALIQSLPGVTNVRREIVMEADALTPEAVLEQHQNRSIVLFNQVRRAQDFYNELRKEAGARKLHMEIILLHSRFFKADRHIKEERLRELFGKGSRANAVLISTQVIEAGVDISCEHLHTELCPVNSLVQRAGRCARFEGEQGAVHVYPLPEQGRTWLPYGDQEGPDETLTATRSLLADIGRAALSPTVVDDWVQKVHQAEDETAVRQGWSTRLAQCLQCVENVAVHRQESGAAHLIRGENEDQIRLIISREGNLPAAPGKREGLSVRRQSLFNLLRGPVQPAGWSWDASGEEPTWKPLKGSADITSAYVVCLKPEVAAYDRCVGLRLNEAGDEESPSREQPQRPGVPALRREAWTDHARKVAQEAQRRLEQDELIGLGLLGWGLERRYGLSAGAVRRAVCACALLHDLGKLQTAWQEWAEAYQRVKLPGYQHVTPLAHTDFDSQSEQDWAIQRALGLRRPPHSAASTYYGAALLARLLGEVRELECVASACAAAVLGHHGGWWSDVGALAPTSASAISELLGWELTFEQWSRVSQYKDKKGKAEALLKLTVSGNELHDWWPLVAYLTRILRLSDQRATSEAAANE